MGVTDVPSIRAPALGIVIIGPVTYSGIMRDAPYLDSFTKRHKSLNLGMGAANNTQQQCNNYIAGFR
jgi:hypothetical protein